LAGPTPYITSGDINVEASVIKRIRAGYRNGLPGDSLSLSFITSSDTVWNEAKTITVHAAPNDTVIREYVFDTSSCSQWNGVVKQIRLKLPAGTGSFSLDYVNMETESTIKVTGDNLLVNPGMEADDLSQYIASNAVHEFAGIASNSTAHSGVRSLKVSKQAKYGSEIINAGLVNGQEYYYSAWVKLDPESVSQRHHR